MLTLEDIMEILPPETKVACETLSQRRYVIRTLIDAGAKHGSSGFSKRVYVGADVDDEKMYMNPGLSDSFGNKSPYATAWAGNPGNKSISFEEFESFVNSFNATFDDGDIEQLLAVSVKE